MPRRSLNILFFHLGFLVLICQAVFVREFLVLFYGNEIALGVFFAAWLWWIGAGAMLANVSCQLSVVSCQKEFRGQQPSAVCLEPAERTEASLPPTASCPEPAEGAAYCVLPTALWMLFLLLPFAALAELSVLRHARGWMATPVGEIAPLGALAAFVLLATIPVGVIAGLMFPLACRSQDKSSIGRLYGFEALGSCAGGLVFTFWWVEAFSPITIFLILLALAGAHASIAGLAAGWAGRRQSIAGAVCLAAGALALLSGFDARWSRASQLARFATLQPHLEMVEAIDTKYQHAAIAQRGGQRVLLSNGKIVCSFPDRRAVEQKTAFVMAQRPGARRVLLIGGGLEGPVQQLLRFNSVQALTVVEQDAELVSLVRRHLPEDLRAPLSDSRLRIVSADARRFVSQAGAAAAGDRYDVVWIVMPDPSTAYLNRVYTREFFESLKRLMAPDGVAIASVTSAEHYLGADVLTYGASVFATLRSVFAEVAITPGDVNTFAACPRAGQATDDWRVLSARYAAIRPTDSTFPPDGFASILPPPQVVFVRGKFEKADAPLNTDLRPATYYFNMILWGRFSGSAISDLLQSLRRAGLWALIAPLLAALVLRVLSIARRGADAAGDVSNFASVVAIVGVGLFAMASDMVLLFTYQSLFGVVYERVGLVVSLFMLGLAAGSLALSGAHPRRPRLALCVALGALAAYAAAAPALIRFAASMASVPAGELAGAQARVGGLPAECLFFILLFLAGAISGAAFPLASLAHAPASGQTTETAAWLDAADHGGGALGALATGTFMVPMLGVVQTAYGLACVAGFVLLVNLLEAAPRARLAPRRGEVWAWTLAWVTLSVYLGALGGRERKAPGPSLFPDSLLSELSGRDRFEARREPFTHYRVMDATEPEAIFSSMQTAPDARGWGGPIPLLIDMDGQKVRHLRLLAHNETPSYVEGIEDWIKQFEGWPIERGFALGKDKGVDAITGATVTSRAVVDALNRSAYAAGTRLFGKDLDASRYAVQTWRAALLTWQNLLLALSFALMILIYIWARQWSRYALIGFNLAALGIVTNQVFTLSDIARLSAGQLFTPSNAAVLLLTVLVALAGLTMGSVFCGYLCPFGVLQEILSLIGRARAISPRVLGGVVRLRYALLALGLTGFWLSGMNSAFVSFSPMEFIFSFKMTPLLWILATVIGIGCLRYFRFWCRCFCPAGALISLFNHVALFDRYARKRRRANQCQVGMASVEEIGCIRCNRCVDKDERSVSRDMGWDLPAFVLAVLILASCAVWSDATRLLPTAGGGRAMDARLFERGLKSGQIVEREAQFYHKVEDQEAKGEKGEKGEKGNLEPGNLNRTGE